MHSTKIIFVNFQDFFWHESVTHICSEAWSTSTWKFTYEVDFKWILRNRTKIVQIWNFNDFDGFHVILKVIFSENNLWVNFNTIWCFSTADKVHLQFLWLFSSSYNALFSFKAFTMFLRFDDLALWDAAFLKISRISYHCARQIEH